MSYKINLPEGLRKIHPVFHVSLLKKFEGPAPLARAPVFTDDQQQEFEVEEIIDVRTRRNKKEYLI